LAQRHGSRVVPAASTSDYMHLCISITLVTPSISAAIYESNLKKEALQLKRQAFTLSLRLPMVFV
jgi:hypothetical protein